MDVMCIEKVIQSLLSIEAIRIYGGLLAAYVVYRLGLRAFYQQKSFDNFQKRYLSEGIDLWASQVDYALWIFRNNWSLMLRVLKQYRESEETLNMDDFFKFHQTQGFKALLATNYFGMPISRYFHS